jgi:hypothetical protein
MSLLDDVCHMTHVLTALDQRDPSSTGGQHGRKSAMRGAQIELPAEDSTHDDAGTAGVVSFRAKVELRLGKPIVTTHVYPPIPCRKHDWCAYPAGEEEDGHYGWGRTEDEAVGELIEMLRDNERIPE